MQDIRYCDCSPGCDIPYGYCHDGCGGKTPLAPQTIRKLGRVKGKPIKYIFNHHTRKTGPKYEVDENGCWLWLGATTHNGYAQMRPHGSKTMRPAHRWYYEQAKGLIPPGLQLDHVCHSNDESCLGGPTCHHRRCVNPDHLEPVTNRENSERGRPGGPKASYVKPKPTHCKRGHAFTPENTIVGTDGGWRCRICDNASQRRAYYKRAAAAGIQPRQRLGPKP